MSNQMSLEDFACPVIGVDAAMRIRACNAAAEPMLGGSGPLLADRGRLTTRVSADDIALGRLVVDAGTARASGGLVHLSGEPPRVARVAPVRRRAPDGSLRRVTALIFVGAPGASDPAHAQAIERAFGFAPEEARVAAGLLYGHSILAIAAGGLDEQAVRRHADRLLVRTGARHQGELADRLVMAVGLRAQP